MAVLVDRDYRPEMLMKFEAEKFEQLIAKSPYLVGGDGSFWCDWGEVAEWENHLVDLSILRAVLQEAKFPHLDTLDQMYADAVDRGKDKFAEEFGHYITVAKGDKAFVAALQKSSAGHALADMIKAFKERPSCYMDAKRLLRSIGFKMYKLGAELWRPWERMGYLVN